MKAVSPYRSYFPSFNKFVFFIGCKICNLTCSVLKNTPEAVKFANSNKLNIGFEHMHPECMLRKCSVFECYELRYNVVKCCNCCQNFRNARCSAHSPDKCMPCIAKMKCAYCGIQACSFRTCTYQKSCARIFCEACVPIAFVEGKRSKSVICRECLRDPKRNPTNAHNKRSSKALAIIWSNLMGFVPLNQDLIYVVAEYLA